MGDITYIYSAYRSTQTAESKPLILFAAPAVDIEHWAGIPQRGRLDDRETVGFQREQRTSRVNELAKFFAEQRNVVQNPLLAALQDETYVEFIEQSEQSSFGELRITCEDYASLPMIELFRRLARRLEARTSGALRPETVDQVRVDQLIERFADLHGLADTDYDADESSEDDITEADISDAEDITDVANVLLADETQIVDFYNDIQGRIAILERYGRDDLDDVLGFTREAVLGYLKPTVLVDGQHRLRGAIETARHAADARDGDDAIMRAIDEGLGPDQAERQVLGQYARSLPVSLLMDSSPSEHVFQFIVVNQKATPMGKALLGTIVSTSLSQEELEPVAKRLEAAGIKLQDSQAVAYLTRAADSPFCGLVQTGMGGDKKNLLQWNVLRGLVGIFRDLRDGKLYHDTNDYAKEWGERYLEGSELAVGIGEVSAKENWRRLDGPWRTMFIKFYTYIRDEFGDVNDENAANAWGNTAGNLYNKVYLTILAADFFSYLYNQKIYLNDWEDLDAAMEEWLTGVSRQYFNRQWPLQGMKKDIPAVRNAWSKTWSEYRAVPNALPHPNKFRG